MMKQGTGIKEIQVWLGHSDIGVTANIYAHMDSEGKRDAAVKIGEALKDEENKDNG